MMIMTTIKFVLPALSIVLALAYIVIIGRVPTIG